MTRVCIILGEGKSERAFLSSFLVTQLGFNALQSRNNNKFQSNNDKELFWFTPKPSMGLSHAGGKTLLTNVSTYIECRSILASHSYLLGECPELHYIILTDGDSKTNAQLSKRRKDIEDICRESKLESNSIYVHFIKEEIEAWFIAGLKSDFPYLKKISPQSMSDLLEIDPESIKDPKEYLDNILNEDCVGNRIRIGSDFGEHLNIAEAERRSATFKSFMQYLRDKKLI